MVEKKPVRVVFVCLGNICRSPAAEGLLVHLAKKGGHDLLFEVESRGIGDWHIGQLPDLRMREVAERRGVILVSRAEQFLLSDYDQFDLIFAADEEVEHLLLKKADTPEKKGKIHLMTHFSSQYKGKDIPDPYYKGEGAFEEVLDMLEDSCQAILEHIKSRQRNL